MVPCPVCSLALVLPARGVEVSLLCAGCRREVTVVGWPALERALVGPRLPQAVADGEAACFSCSGRAATGVCDGCGCYTCPACEATWFGESLCLSCLHARREIKAAPRFRHRTLLQDNIALMMLVLPIMVIPFYGFFFSVLASPVALFWVIRHRKSPRGLPPRGPWRLLLAGGLAIFLMLSVAVGIGALAMSLSDARRTPRGSLPAAPAGWEDESAGGDDEDKAGAEEDPPTKEEAP